MSAGPSVVCRPTRDDLVVDSALPSEFPLAESCGAAMMLPWVDSTARWEAAGGVLARDVGGRGTVGRTPPCWPPDLRSVSCTLDLAASRGAPVAVGGARQRRG